MRWYISVAAVHDYQRIAGYPPADDGPDFDAAAKELDQVCQEAKLKKDEGHRQLWEAKTQIDGLVARLELTVTPGPRAEGPLPQLVRVRHKGGARTGRRQ